LFAEDYQFLPKVKSVAKINDTRVPFTDLSDTRGCHEPLRQRPFSHWGARNRKQLIEASFAEQI
jgi:hypothetical protein